MKTRDMSRAEYVAKMNAHGFEQAGFMGYWCLPIPGHSLHVSDLNAGDNRRAKLAYMLKKLDEELAKPENSAPTAPVTAPCPHDPRILAGQPIGMYHCPECGEMVIAGMVHPDYSLLAAAPGASGEGETK